MNTPRSTGLAKQLSAVGLTPARAMTSHLRKHYHEKYKGRYRFSRVAFGFDLVLTGIVLALLVFDVIGLMGLIRPMRSGIAVELDAPPLRASDTVPIQITLRSSDRKTHEDVRMQWKFPEWADVLSSSPAMQGDGAISLGEIKPGVDKTIRFLVHIRATAGTRVPINFTLEQLGAFGFLTTYTGSENRTIESSVLSVTPVVDARAVVSGGSIPLRIANAGNTTSSLLTLRLTQAVGAPDAKFSSGDSSLSVSSLAPNEQRVAYIDIGDTTATQIQLNWELQDQAQVVFARQREYEVVSSTDSGVSDVGIHWVQGQPGARISLQSASNSARAIISPGAVSSSDAFQILPLSRGANSLVISLPSSASSSAVQVVPIDDALQGGVLGIRSEAQRSATFPLSAEARYYSASGDQLGVGPLPPQVGQQTTYWVVWTIGPTETDLSQLTLKTTLPNEVSATGKFASAVQGTFQVDGKQVSWTIPSLPATGGGTATFAFEVALTPSVIDRGHAVTLIGASAASAVETNTNKSVEAVAGPDTTSLTSDQKAKGEGIVL